jgi:hypothetical protein
MLLIRVWEGKPPFLFMDEEEYKQITALSQPLEYYEVQNMLNYALQAEDLVRGAFPKISLEILFINLYNLSRLRDVEKVLSSVNPSPSARPQRPPHDEPPPEPAAPTPEKNRTKAEGPPSHGRVPDAPVEPPQDTAEPAVEPTAAARSPKRTPQAREFLEYLKAQSPFISSVLESLEIRVEDGKLIILLDKNYGFIKSDNNIIGELKNQAAQFFGKEVALQFSEGNGPKQDTLDDYVKEARSLFNV